MAELNKANTVFRQAAGQQQLLAEIVRGFFAYAIHVSYVLGFVCEIDHGRSCHHHVSGQFISFQTAGNSCFGGVLVAELFIEIVERFHAPIALFRIGIFLRH